MSRCGRDIANTCLDSGIELADWAMGWQPAEEKYNTTVCNLVSG
jgi:hypothetical protein